MYLPNVGLMVFLATVLSMVHPLAWVPVFVVYLVRYITFMPMYKNMDAYLRHHTYWFPEVDRGWIYRANFHAKNGDVFGVMYLSNEGLIRDMNSPMLWLHRAAGFKKLGQTKLYEQATEMALKSAEGEMIEIVEDKIKKQYIKE
jgi:hypothetical protein